MQTWRFSMMRMMDRRRLAFASRQRGVAMAGFGLVLLALASVASGADVGPGARFSELDYVVDFWRAEQGLPNNTVNALLQTRDGYLWVGTASGLTRFDGLVFTLIGDETAPGLKEARITALLEDRAGALWVGTQDGGVVRLRRGQAEWFGQSQGLTDKAVTSLAEDLAGRIWIGTQSGLNLWERGRLSTFAMDPTRPGEAVVALHAGRSGVLWVTLRSEVYRLHDGRAEPFKLEDMPQGRNAEFVGAYEDRAGDLWTFGATFLLNLSKGRRFNYFRSFDPGSSRLWTICEQGEGAFWIGTSGRGLFRFHDGRFDITGARDGLDQCDVRALQADREGHLWIGTSGSGLARLRVRQWRVLGRNEGLTAANLTSLAADAEGKVWVGSADAGLLQIHGERFEPVVAGPPLDRATHVRSLCFDRSGALWVGTWGAGLFRVEGGRQARFTTADGLGDDVITAVTAERDGDGVWAGTWSGGLHRVGATNLARFTAAEGLTGKPILCLLATADGGLLIGSEGGGLVRWENGRLAPLPGPTEFQTQAVRCLAEDRAGRWWVGTAGAGVFCRSHGNWVTLSSRQGLASDVIGQMVQDDTGSFWFGSEQGVFQVRTRDMETFLSGRTSGVTCLLGGRDEGGDSLKCAPGWPGAVQTPDGRLWFAGKGAVFSVDPAGIPKTPAPQVMIEQVLVDGRALPPVVVAGDAGVVKLGPGVRSLDVAFTAVSFTAPERTRFRHRLEGFDLDWVPSDAARRAHYGPLPPGQYRFRVIASNADGVWNETGAALSLEVAPPLWRAWWFLLLCAAALVGLIWTTVHYVSVRRLEARLHESEHRRAMERERTRIAQDMHDEIGSKLTRISFLSEVARQAGPEARAEGSSVEAIAHTSRELLKSLDEIVWAVNPRNDNLEHLAGYFEQYAREYFQNTAVECEIAVPTQLPRSPLSAELRHNLFLAFEEALGNALKHAQATKVRINMALLPRAFEILVQDNGRGFASATGAGEDGRDGLDNMRNRLRMLGGSCEVHSEERQGTTVRLHFPLADPTLLAS